jgi:hypothetical protein
VAGAFEALAGDALAGVAGWLEGAAGALAGTRVGDFAGGVAEAAAGGGVSVDFADFFERLFLGVALSALAVADAGAAGAPVSVEAEPFFERDFLGVAELSEGALLSAVSVFFDLLFFLEDAVPDSDAACELEASASGFFFFLLFVAVPASLWLLSAGCCAACAQMETVPARSNRAVNRAMYRLLAVFILKLSLRPRRLNHSAKYARKSAAGWGRRLQLLVAGLPGGMGESCSQNEWEVKMNEIVEVTSTRPTGGCPQCEFERELYCHAWGNQEVRKLPLARTVWPRYFGAGVYVIKP